MSDGDWKAVSLADRPIPLEVAAALMGAPSKRRSSWVIALWARGCLHRLGTASSRQAPTTCVTRECCADLGSCCLPPMGAGQGV